VKFEWMKDDHAVCPKCKESWADLWDYGWGSADELRVNCPYCDARITLKREYSVEYAVADGWTCWRCDGLGSRYQFAEKCQNNQCDHGLGDRPMSCPVEKLTCAECKGTKLQA